MPRRPYSDRDARDLGGPTGERIVDGERLRDARGRTAGVLRAHEPETAFALLVARDGRVEVRRAEIGPENVGEVQLGIGEPVEKEVRNAALAARADDQIGVADRQ